ncbi:phosphogluconate dehydrogenase C-terminal domain-containing protein [Cryobacterium sp. Y62]|uniref:phosphogluconate dehydrogenase C-terminal domain-containing protein n=1 Tax=Cryobacterium sp. Y62 TaxID=2048284 RepID=UPI000CE5085A|nr:phosphogluconate dehydrogenase C-terminal domain-containing protein [Cryobacterium sp. Y62]
MTIPTSLLTVAVIGAGGKMGMRVSNNLDSSTHRTYFSDISTEGQRRITDAGRVITPSAEAISAADVVILAVPDIALGKISAEIVPGMKPGSILFTLDPAAAYANLLFQRDDIAYAVAHPCHPSVFLQRKTQEEVDDTFGGIAAPQDVVAALDSDDQETRQVAEGVIRSIYSPVADVHWVTVKQLAYLEPTLVEVVACMVGDLLKEALNETVHKIGVPEKAARAMLDGHIQVALAIGLHGDHVFSDACLVAMDYGRGKIIRDDWKEIFDDRELDNVLARMLQLNHIDRQANN